MRMLVIGDFHGKFSEKLKKRIISANPDLIVGVGDYAGVDDWYSYIKYMFKQSISGKEWMPAGEFFGKKKFNELVKKDFEAGKGVLNGLKGIGKPVILVFGNGDDVWYKYLFAKNWAIDRKALKFVRKLGVKNITYGLAKFEGIKFAGFGGYMDVKANYDNKKKGDRDSWKRAIKRVRMSRQFLFRNLRKSHGADILVLHYPPEGAFDIISDKNNPYHGKSAGIESFREAILKFKPKIALCGHMHEYQGAKKIGKTLVVNPGDAERGRFAVIDYPGMKVKFFK